MKKMFVILLSALSLASMFSIPAVAQDPNLDMSRPAAGINLPQLLVGANLPGLVRSQPVYRKSFTDSSGFNIR